MHEDPRVGYDLLIPLGDTWLVTCTICGSCTTEDMTYIHTRFHEQQEPVAPILPWRRPRD